VAQSAAASAARAEASRQAVADGQGGNPAEALLQQFMDLLGEDPALDETARAWLQGELTEAMAGVDPSNAEFEAPDRAAWMQAADALQAAGAVSDDEANALVRQLDSALSALDRKESRLAMEFSRRMSRDGEAAALEWLRENRELVLGDGAGKAEAVGTGGAGGQPPLLATDAVRSRSRRVRGPPPRGVR